MKGGSCAHVLVISLPLVPCLPPQLAFCYDKDIMLGTLNRSNFAIDHTPLEDVSEGQDTVRERFCSSSFVQPEQNLKDKRT